LYCVHRQIFGGVERTAFRRYVTHPDADGNLVCLYRDPEGAPVGYCSLQHRDLDLSGGAVRVLRGAMGFLPAFRGRTLAASFYAPNLLRLTAGAWMKGRRPFMLSSPVSPLMYLSIARTMEEFWPCPGGETPAAISHLMDELRSIYAMGDGAVPSACPVGWVARHGAAEHARFAESERPEIRFFLQNNPRYADGEGLVLLAPMNLRNIVSGLRRAAMTRRRRSPSKGARHAVAS